MLKRFMLGAAIAAVLTAPAFAQSYYGGAGSGNLVSPSGVPITAGTPAYLGPGAAYAQVKPGTSYYAPGAGANAFAYQPRAYRGHRLGGTYCRGARCDYNPYTTQ